MFNTSLTSVGRRFVTVAAMPGEDAASLITRFVAAIDEQGGSVARVLACGPAAQRSAALAALEAHFGALDFSVTWLLNDQMRGLQADLVDAPLERLTWKGRVCGVRWSDAAGEWLMFGGMRIDRPDLNLQDRYEATFEEAEAALAAHGFTFFD